MKPLRIWITVILAASTCDLLGQEVPLSPDCVMRFANVEEAEAILGAEDAFTRRMSRFDLQSRLHTQAEVRSADYLRAAIDDIQPWSDASIETVLPAAEQLGRRVREWKLPLPEEVLLVCTAGTCEAGAPHTRGNAIVLPEQRLGRRQEDLPRLLAHELFHIASRQSPEWRDQVYATIGFQPCDEVRLSEAYRDRRITNPDAPIVQHYITVTVEDEQVQVAPVLLANIAQYDPSREASFFAYLQVKFVQLQQEQARWTPRFEEDGTLVGYPISALDDFLTQVGTNTKYLIHPEEILADNFSFLVTGKQVAMPEVIERIEALLTEP
ncbi:hypothetical protein Poly24_25000 [Rosistilla carotiformis]|uniref:DUF4157 domain-containing protein n=1 Tax=Rosistilla carotiformis TaxID=2528017 RepID=A0A518JTB8_9BACT|nr:hypothetical protein [Rosistilla carotiformis]QDV68787.1 hypothetical protein Poly24_25000 [Rosistilla carotiformis]